MFRSAVTASSRALLRVAAASLRPSSLHPSVASTSPVASIRPLLPCASTLRFRYDFSRGYARGKQAVSSKDDDDDDDDYNDDDDDDDIDYNVSDESDYTSFSEDDADDKEFSE